MKIRHAVLAIALGLACGTAMANSHGHGKGAGMGCAGAEHAGMAHAQMSPEQHKAKMETHWAELDADKNGSISRAEFDRHHAAMAANRAQHAGHAGHAGHGAAKDPAPAQ